jgi:prepilin-type N-terminal cleavage/methylation domain-containing protein
MRNPPAYLRQTYQNAFTLVEMAVVLVIIGLVLSGLLVSLSAQVEQKSFNETETTIDNIKEALLGYAMANGRFPCPAVTPATGITAVEAFAAGGNATKGNCSGFFNGYVPSVTLGLSPTDTSGYVLDGWNNPIRYAIANLSDDANATYIFTKSSGMKTANSTTCSPNCGMTWIASQTLLSVCSTGTGIASGACSSATTRLTQGAVMVIYSTGKNTATGGTGTDEAANLDADAAFVSHVPFGVGATNGEFDDLVEWTAASSIFSHLVQANQLP